MQEGRREENRSSKIAKAPDSGPRPKQPNARSHERQRPKPQLSRVLGESTYEQRDRKKGCEIDDGGRIRVGLVGDDLAAGPLGPDAELLDGGGTKCVGGGQEDAAATSR